MVKSKYFLLALLIWLTIIWTACPGEKNENEILDDRNITKKQLSSIDAKAIISLVDGPDGKPYIQMDFSYVWPADKVQLHLPREFLRKEHLYRRIVDLKTDSGSMHDVPNRPYIKILKKEPSAPLSYRYLIRPNDPTETADRKESFSAPIIRKDYFQFIGKMALVLPTLLLNSSDEYSVKISWQIPGFKLYNSFGAEDSEQKITTTSSKLMDSFFEGGSNTRSQKIFVKGNPVYLTFNGAWDDFADNDYAYVLKKLLETQRDTWADNNFPFFLASLLQLRDKCPANAKFAGTAHNASFRAYYPKECKFSAQLRQLVSHELMHVWIGKKVEVGKQRIGADGKWFSEGFTDYYGRILALRADVLSLKAYLKSLNIVFGKYYTSSERNTPLSQVIERLYIPGLSKDELEQLPYQQGEILALLLDAKIRRENPSKSLDDVIRDMLIEAKDAGGKKNFSVDDIDAAIKKYLPEGLMPSFSAIQEGKVLEPPELPRCMKIKRNAVLSYEFDRGIATGVDCRPWLYAR